MQLGVRSLEPRGLGSIILTCSVFGLLALAFAGCSFRSELDRTRCDESREGERRDGQICRNGFWVRVDAAPEDTGTPDVDGGGGETCVPTDEKCNFRDDDCDGRVDEGIDCSCNFRDESRGVCGDARLDEEGNCQRPGAYNEREVRCDDGKDNDCDGNIDTTDSDCQCTGNESRECYTGPDDTLSGENAQGICSKGAQTCSRGVWGACEGQKLPDSGEICMDGKDNDCDGGTDEGCPCVYDPTEPNGVDTDGSNDDGVCLGQTVDGSGAACQKPPKFDSSDDEQSAGRCDGVDNDCDGAVDEGCTCTFDPSEPGGADTDGSHGSGVCIGQTRDGSGSCERPSNFETRTDDESLCDGTDNDCDGTTDEGCTCDYTGSSQGVCGSATRNDAGTCQKPSDYDMTDDESAVPNCDGVDNDCDGATDENCPCDYSGSSQGVCGSATRSSSGACQKPGDYDGTDDESAVPNCDGVDNDCDGATDEGCTCTYDPFESRRTDTDGSHDSGICTSQTRDSSGACQRPSGFETKTPSEDSCSGDDNDCDGVVDEGCPCVYDPTEGPRREDTDGDFTFGVCRGQTINTNGVCTTPGSFESRTSSESSCMGEDNDCDGAIDEGCPCVYDPTESARVDTDGSHAAGICTGQSRNSSGSCRQPSGFAKTQGDAEPPSACGNGTDDDCDGVVDDGCSCVYDPTEPNSVDTDNSHASGVCTNRTRDGSGVCQAPTGFEPTQGDAESGASCIDGIDNDCDGTTDEGCPCTYDPTESNDIDTDGSNDDGVCTGQTLDSSGTACQMPSAFDSTDDESSAGNCDLVDNDCDGAVDEGCSCDYTGTPTGVCSNGTRDSNGTCQAPGSYQSPEVDRCSDGLDNDCDGTTDEATKDGGVACSSDCECYSDNCTAAGVCAHRVFVTSNEYDGDLGGLTGADSICQSAASGAGLSGTWKAILSDGSTDAKGRLTIDGRVQELDGTRIVNDSSDMWDGDIDDEIADNQTGPGNTITTCGDSCDDDHVWTGSNSSGNRQGNYCSDWSSNDSDDSGHVGDASTRDSDWIDHMDESCDADYHIYCIDGQ